MRSNSKIDPRKTSSVVVAVLFLLAGAGACVAAAYQAERSIYLSRAGRRTEGTVTSVRSWEERDSDGHHRIRYESVVEYQTETGVQRTSLSSRYKQGDRVPLLYDPSAPDVVRTPAALWLVPGGLALVALVFGGVGGALCVLIRRGRQDIAWLERFGQRIQGTIVGVNADSHEHDSRGGTCFSSGGFEIRSGSRHRRRRTTMYRLVVEIHHPAAGRINLESYPLPCDPGNQVIGQSIDVLVDPLRADRYLIDR